MGLKTFTERAVRLKGQPFSLRGRPYLHEVYAASAENLVLRASRQVEKSTLISNLIFYKAYRHPGIQILFVAPRVEQARLFSNARLHPVLSESPVLRRLLWPSPRRIPVGDIVFTNQSRIYIRAAFHSADGCRGISADALFLDEFQDLAPGALPVLQETLSHSERPQIVITGTPKLLENPLETVFRQSTACEWHVTCTGCRKELLLDERTLGPGSLICPSCQQPLDPQSGHWIPRNPDSTWGKGYAINHLMVPWLNVDEILERQRTYDRALFVNEVLGLPVALGDHVITREEAEACCEDRAFAVGIEDVLPACRARLVAGIDWGGGASSGTVLVLGHILNDRHFRVVRFDRWLPHVDPDVVLKEVAERCRRFQIRWIAADGDGNGHVYNRLLLTEIGYSQRGPVLYTIYYSATTQDPVRDGVLIRWTVNRSRNIGAVFSRIKAKLISFPRVQESSSFLNEFVCELAEYDELMRTIKYTKPETERDDALHATVYAEVLALRMAAASSYQEHAVRSAIGANVANSDTFVSNAGIIEINRSLQRTEFAGLVEGDTFLRYFVTPRLTARVGYEFWWIHGVALAPRQIGAAITQNTGRHLEGTTEVLFYGASAGVEYVWQGWHSALFANASAGPSHPGFDRDWLLLNLDDDGSAKKDPSTGARTSLPPNSVSLTPSLRRRTVEIERSVARER